MSADFFPASERLLSATANGVYQGVLVAVLAGLALRMFPRTNAATRHAVWYAALLLVAALIPAHLLLSSRRETETRPAASRLESRITESAPAPTVAANPSTPEIADALIPDPQPVESDADGGLRPADSPAPTLLQSDSGRPSIKVKDGWTRFKPVILKPLFWNLETPISLPHSICLGLVGAWVLLAVARGALIARGLREVRQAKTSSTAPSEGLQSLFDHLCDSLPARRRVQLRISSQPRTAVVLGFLHPVVLLPAEMDNSAQAAEVEHVLRHELAHVDRRDDWGNLAQQIIQAALFFHPAVWWISARLSLEREIACDDHVLEASGRPRAYALTLANVASRVSQCRHLLAPGVSNNHSQLQQRITMILNTHRDRSTRLTRSRLGIFTTAAALLAVLAINAGPRVVLAQSPEALPAAAGPETTPPAAPSAELPPSPDNVATALPPDQPGVESGPKYKPSANGNGNDNDTHNYITTILPPPAPAGQPPPPPPLGMMVAPVVGVAPVSPGQPPAPPLVMVAPAAGLVTVSPATTTMSITADAMTGTTTAPEAPMGRRIGKKNQSIEERLDRIERILEGLEARDGAKTGRHRDDSLLVLPNLPLTMSMGPNADMELKRAAAEAKRAEDEAKRAAEEVRRAAERSMRDFERMKSDRENWRDVDSDGHRKAIDALCEARDSLDRQRDALNRQIQRLKEDWSRHSNTPRGGRDSAGPKSEDNPKSPDGAKWDESATPQAK